MRSTVMHEFKTFVATVAGAAAITLLLVACTPAEHRVAPSPEASMAEPAPPGSTAPVAVSASTTSTTEELTTSTTEEPTTAIVTTTAPPERCNLPDGVELLSAHSNGIDLLRGDSSVPVLEGVDVSLAWPDYLGGVIFQRVADQPDWEFDDDLDRWMPQWPDGVEVSGIERTPEIGAPAEMLVSGDAFGEVHGTSIALIEGAPTLMYNRMIGVEHPCEDEDSEDVCTWKWFHGFAGQVVALDFETGQERPLGISFVFETSAGVSIGGSVAAVTETEPAEVAMVDVADLAALGTTGHVLETVPSAWMVYTPEPRCDPVVPGTYQRPEIRSLSVSPDGTTLALVESHPPCSDGDMGSVIVVLDLSDRGDEPVYELNTRLLDSYAYLVDYDGNHLLLLIGGQHIVMDRHGTITALPECECRYRFWSEPS